MQLSKKRLKISRILLSTLLFLTLVFYLIIPFRSVVSMPLFYTCFSLMLLSNYIYFKAKQKKNYLDFDTIFIAVYCLVGFSTTFFYNNQEVFSAIFLGFPVDVEYINKGNLLFLIGLQSYMVGSLVPIPLKKQIKRPFVIKTNFLVALVFILIISFIAFGGIDYYRSEYNTSVKGESGIVVKYILLLLVTTAMALIGTEFYNKKIDVNYKISWITFIGMFFLVCTLLGVGNRTAASQILLPVLCLYAFFFKKISFKKFLIFVSVGIVLMWIIQQTRTGRQSFELTNPIMLILDLTIPMRNTYAALEYVDKNDYTYGSTMVIDASGSIPFLPSLIHESFPELKLGSASLLTDYTFLNAGTPEEFQIGLGTTIIADLFLAFGFVGVVVLMYFLGYCVNKWSFRSLDFDYYSVVILSAMLGNAIFIVRAGYLHPLRFVIWALVLASLNRFLHRAWKK
ncbi:O-antigen polymerase [Sphingobacterium tabacisoli]|uniref:O-antigen polymerase n=1 Tax=Sphingobacterium tabacisoli TaxID=2044855 RepID=A0ABW5L397_9SPHI|nr:O-antigen polymerase [Sphingobacterium tabacisoli]